MAFPDQQAEVGPGRYRRLAVLGAWVAGKHPLIVTRFSCWAGAHVCLVELLTWYLPYEGHHSLLRDPSGPRGIVPTLPLPCPPAKPELPLAPSASPALWKCRQPIPGVSLCRKLCQGS